MEDSAERVVADGTAVPLAAVAGPSLAPSPEISAELAELEGVSKDLAAATRAPATVRAYATAWRSFSTFAGVHHLQAAPAHPESVRWYVAWMATQVDEKGLPRFAVSTIRQHLAGIAHHHLAAGLLDPTTHYSVTALVAGLARLRATRPRRRRPLLLDEVTAIIDAMDHRVYPAGISAARDTLAIWLGFVAALRRSEVAGLRMNSLSLSPRDGVHLRVGASKVDQDNSRPDLLVLPFGSNRVTCPVCVLHHWVALVKASAIEDRRERRRATMSLLLDAPEEHVCHAVGPGLITPGDLDSPSPLLRATYRNRRGGSIHEAGVSGDALHTMLRTRVFEAGLDPREVGFHSLRAGHVTQARRGGASTEAIMRAGRWSRAATVEVYDREADPMVRNSVTSLGL